MYDIEAFLSQKTFFKTRTAANQLISFCFCFIIQRKAKIRLLFINKKFVFISKRFIIFYSLKRTKYSLIFYYLTFVYVFFRFDFEKIWFLSFIIEEICSISKKNVRYRSIFIPKKHFLNKDSFQSALFRFCFIIQSIAKIRLYFIITKIF